MATTTNYSWTTPDNTAYVKDGASAIRTLGSSVDSTLFSVSGGKNVGMVLLNTTTFSAVTTLTINNVFSSAYDNYRIEISNFTSANTGSAIFFRLTASGTPAATNYSYAGINAINSTIGFFGQTGTTQGCLVMVSASTNACAGAFEVSNPALTTHTSLQQVCARIDASNRQDFYSSTGTHYTSTAYDGFQIYHPSTLNIAGTIRIYGYRNS